MRHLLLVMIHAGVYIHVNNFINSAFQVKYFLLQV